MKYEHVFFDLDRTLWDFDKNSKETLIELYQFYDLVNKGINCVNEFIKQCFNENHLGWIHFRDGLITKEELRARRFNNALKNLGLSSTQKLSRELNAYYMDKCPQKTNLLPFAKELLTFLSNKYSLHIITNGFEQPQLKKINNSGLSSHFKHIITADIAGTSKPSAKIFEFSLSQTKAKPHESIMIGDDLQADIIGARNFGMDQIYFNQFGEAHTENISHEVSTLFEITKIL